MNTVITRNGLLFFGVIVLYKLSLDFIYAYIFIPNYGYFFSLNMQFLYGKYLVTLVLILAMIKPLIALLRKGNGSSMIILLLSLVYFIPGCTVYALGNLDNSFFAFFSLYWVVLVSAQLLLPNVKGLSIQFRGKSIIFTVIIAGFATCILFLSGMYTNFHINLSLQNVYELRFAAREYSVSTVIQYLLNASYIILPLGTMYFIVNKQRGAAVILLLVQLLSFSFNGKKSVLFTIFIVLLIAKFYKKERLQWILPAFLGLNLLSILELFIGDGNSFIAKYIHRRVLFTPPIIGANYFDFFSINELDFLRQSFLRWFEVSSPYPIPIARLIGYNYFNNVENNANTGMVGDAFANFGWAGLLYPVLIIVALRFFDKCSINLDYRIISLLCVLIFYKFINGSFFTVMLTGGFIITCIVLVICPRKPEGNLQEDIKYKYYWSH